MGLAVDCLLHDAVANPMLLVVLPHRGDGCVGLVKILLHAEHPPVLGCPEGVLHCRHASS